MKEKERKRNKFSVAREREHMELAIYVCENTEKIHD